MKSFSLAMLLVGTIIGAGFASGREILSFFGPQIPMLVAPLCGLAIFAASVLFLLVGKKIKASTVSEVNSKVLGKIHVVADVLLLFNCLVVLSGMLAATDSLFSMVLPIAPAYSLIFGGLCAIIVAKGLKGLLKSNMIVVPMLIVAIVIVCCFAIKSPVYNNPFKWFTLPSVVIYVSMNMMLASTVFTTIKEVSYKQIIVSSAIAGATIATLMQLIIFALQSTGQGGAMPLLQIAQNQSTPLFYISLLAVGASIFTTVLTSMSGLVTWLKGLIGDTKYSVVLVLVAGLLLSNVGFENVVSFIYPVIGVMGGLYMLMCIIFLFKIRKTIPLQQVNAIAKPIKNVPTNKMAVKTTTNKILTKTASKTIT